MMREAQDGDAVLVHYTGYLDDGTQFDSSRQRNDPLSFVLGAGSVIRGFDNAVRGMSVGESVRARIEAKNAYGERREDLVIKMSTASIPDSVDVRKGLKLPLSNGMMGLVVDVDDKEVTLDVNHELAGKALTFEMELVGFEEKVLGEPAKGLERAVFGLGCFWGAELAYQRVAGVISTKVGYAQGQVENPTYQQVCSGSTGHAEVVAVDFDSTQVPYGELLDLFWARLGNNALTKDQVGNDVGSQYRSGIYWTNESQREEALKSKQVANEKMGSETVVEVMSAVDAPFWLAETYHQRYLEKGGQSAEKNATEPIRCYG